MPAIGYLESLLNGLPADIRRIMTAFVRQAFRDLAFGTPSTSAVSCTNFAGHMVPATTSSTGDAEVAVAHGLGRVPRVIFPMLDPSVAGATLPELAITQAADATYVYVSSPETSKRVLLYVE